MDTGFVDLDILLTKIRISQSKAYFLDAVKAYKAGALRAALTSVWVALVYDLIAKYRELGAVGDRSAATFIQSWDAATTGNNVSRLLYLEASIIEDATLNTQIINRIAQKHLERLREDRNFCAHPAFSTEAELFEPSHELVRLHLVNAVDLVLSQEPLQGKAIFDLFDVDVQSVGFPVVHSRILDYVQQRYLERVRSQNILNFGTVLAKSLLKGLPAQWETEQGKIISSLVAIRERATSSWPDISAAIVRLIDNLEPDNRPRAIAFIAAFPDFWQLLKQPTQTALQETVDNAHSKALSDYRILDGLSVPHFRTSLLKLIDGLDQSALEKAIAIKPLAALWPRAIHLYANSGGWRGSEKNLRDLIIPFSRTLGSEEYDQLLDAIIGNDQNWGAAGTASLLLGMLRGAQPSLGPTYEARNRFHRHLKNANYLNSYGAVLTLLQADGWAIPSAQQDGVK